MYLGCFYACSVFICASSCNMIKNLSNIRVCNPNVVCCVAIISITQVLAELLQMLSVELKQTNVTRKI